MAILSKRCKPDNFEPHNSLKRSFTNIRRLRSNLLNVNVSFNQTLLTFLLYMRQTWMTQLILAIFTLIRKDSITHAWSCSLCERRTSFCTGLFSRKLCGFLLMFSTGFTSRSVLLLFPLSITFVVMHGF